MQQQPPRAIIAGLVAAYLVATPIVTWLAIVYSSLGAPWWAVTALWHAQALLLGIWCALGAAPLRRKCLVSLTALVWLWAMPAARQLEISGFPALGWPWQTYAVIYGSQLLYLVVPFAASFAGIALTTKVWPRWRIVAGAAGRAPGAAQFSIGQLLVAVAACTPFLLAARLVHDYWAGLPVRNASNFVLLCMIESPVAATLAILSTWAALGRNQLVLRMGVAPLLLLPAVLLSCFATKTSAGGTVIHILFVELQMVVSVSTLLVFRWTGYRIDAIRPCSPFVEEPQSPLAAGDGMTGTGTTSCKPENPSS
ncbi:MAG TPA: hypothetical protein VFI31_18055 [Pirellulales bacterium]|nr:hypothetical protein [Pirellulales bacterium]